jgi:hypothetical protein
MEEDIMQLREKYLHQEVKVIDGSQEDGQFGYVTGITARSAEPITVLFYVVGEAKHQNFYRPQDLELTGGEWHEGKERDQTVRCRRSRFDGLWYVIDGCGPHGAGCGTVGGAWAHYLSKVVRRQPGKEQNGEEAGVEAGSTMAAAASPVDDVAGGTDGRELSLGTFMGQGTDQADPGEREETHKIDRT